MLSNMNIILYYLEQLIHLPQIYHIFKFYFAFILNVFFLRLRIDCIVNTTLDCCFVYSSSVHKSNR